MSDADDIKLTARELAIAERAAAIAVRKMQDEFYKTIGRSVINKMLIVVGGLAVAASLFLDRWLAK